MLTLKTYAYDIGTPAYWRQYAKSTLPRTNNFRSGARHFAACKGSAVIHHADDSATIFWREEGLGTFRVRFPRSEKDQTL
jgi:hypothetical protein